MQCNAMQCKAKGLCVKVQKGGFFWWKKACHDLQRNGKQTQAEGWKEDKNPPH
jgi:hypothetical protein